MPDFAAILLKSPACPAKLPSQALSGMAAAFGARAARTYEALDGSEAYIYLDLKAQARPGAEFQKAVDAKAAELLAGSGMTAWALHGIADMQGANEGEAAPFFYTVEITAKRDNMPAVSEWYDQEHMPGLAAVPGCAHARRFMHDGGQDLTSCACYQLTNKDIRETAAWNAVRGTPWSERVRPHFLNLKRNMFRALPVITY
jgi:hypothetical protein